MKNLITLLLILVFGVLSAQDIKVRSVRYDALTTAQMNAIPSNKVQEGSKVFNTDTKTDWSYFDNQWNDTGLSGNEAVLDAINIFTNSNIFNGDVLKLKSDFGTGNGFLIESETSTKSMRSNFINDDNFSFDPSGTGASLTYNFTLNRWVIPSTTYYNLDASNFNNNLSAIDNNLQTALETIDNLTLGTGGNLTTIEKENLYKAPKSLAILNDYTLDPDDMYFSSGADIGRKSILVATVERTVIVPNTFEVDDVQPFKTLGSGIINFIPDTGVTLNVADTSISGAASISGDGRIGYIVKEADNLYRLYSVGAVAYVAPVSNFYQENSAAGTGSGLGTWANWSTGSVASITDGTSPTGFALEFTKGSSDFTGGALSLTTSNVNTWSNGTITGGLLPNESYTFTMQMEMDDTNAQPYYVLHAGSGAIVEGNLLPEQTSYAEWSVTFTVPSGGMTDSTSTTFRILPSINATVSKIRIHSFNVSQN